MSTATLYIWDEDFIYVNTVTVDERGALPFNSTKQKPPALTGTQVAKWNGLSWEKLASRPIKVKPVEPEKSIAELQADFEKGIQAFMDSEARKAGYDSLSTAISYAEEDSVPRFQIDGKSFRKWRSLVWDYSYRELQKFFNGERKMTVLPEFLNELPLRAPVNYAELQ